MLRSGDRALAALVCVAGFAAALSTGCALNFDRFLTTDDGGGVLPDGGTPPRRDGGNPTGDTGVRPPAFCAPPVVYAAVEQLDDDTLPGRIMRVSLAGAPARCEDLVGGGRLNPYLRSVAVLEGGRLLVGSRESVQMLSIAEDRVLGTHDISELGRGPEARDVFAIDRGGYLGGAAVYDTSTSSDGVGRLVSVLRFRDDSLTDLDEHDATVASSPFRSKRVSSMLADPEGGDSFWVTNLPSGSSAGIAVQRVPLAGGSDQTLYERFGTSFRVSLATALSPDGDERSFVFTTPEYGGRGSGVLMGRVRATTGAPAYTSDLFTCDQVCNGAGAEYVHAVPDPEDPERAIVVCSPDGGLERSIVRARVFGGLSGVRCTVVAEPPTSRAGRLRVWRIAVGTGAE